MIKPESIKDVDYFSINEVTQIEGAVYYLKEYVDRDPIREYSITGVPYKPRSRTDRIERDEFVFLLNSAPYQLGNIELYIQAGGFSFRVFRDYDDENHRYTIMLSKYIDKEKLESMSNLQAKTKGVVVLTIEEAREFYDKGGVHREIALKAGYTIEELTTTEDEWKDKFVGKSITGYYMTSVSEIFKQTTNGSWSDRSTFRTEQQAKSALAYAQLTQLMALPEYNGTWEPNWSGFKQFKCSIVRLEDEARIIKLPRYYSELTFSSEERCSDFLRKNKMLVNEFLQITKK